jgi:hypothetical protein
MSRLLGGVISELVLIPLNLDFEIDRSWMNLRRFLNDIHIPTRAKYYPHSNSCCEPAKAGLLYPLVWIPCCDTISEKLGSRSRVGNIASDLESWVLCCDRQD